jgi:hypothetical protein
VVLYAMGDNAGPTLTHRKAVRRQTSLALYIHAVATMGHHTLHGTVFYRHLTAQKLVRKVGKFRVLCQTLVFTAQELAVGAIINKLVAWKIW